MTAWFSGCLARPIPTRHGILSWPLIEPVLRTSGAFNARTALVSLEHPHNMGGGTLYAVEAIDDICARAHAQGLKIHLDGARLYNAAIASGISPSRIVQNVDTVTMCLSKGLGAPVGSVIAGPAEAMERARTYRKLLGGGMRQAGVLAAAGLVALDESPAKLATDHQNARLLAEAVGLDPATIHTNIVIFEIASDPAAFIARLKEEGILASAIGGQRIRFVTHYDVSRGDCERAARSAKRLLQN
jgi:threonine aldolase